MEWLFIMIRLVVVGVIGLVGIKMLEILDWK